MKKSAITFLGIGIIFALIGAWYTMQNIPDEKPQILSVTDQNKIITRAPTIPISIAQPYSLKIEKIGVNATIESVGMDAKGAMDVPKDDMNVAWYNLGSKPGEQGSAVIAGHLDTKTGTPAVFWDLAKLTAGDTIDVTDVNGKTATFVVTRQETFDFDKVPLQDIFARNDSKYLNLITCEGTFNKSAKNYSKRLVVYAEMKD